MSHYHTLGIDKTASQEDIKKAYRKLASKYHPDKGGDTAKFQEIQTAYDVLGNMSARQQYDNPNSWVDTGFNAQTNPDMMHDLFKNFGFRFSDDFGSQKARRSARRNQDLRVTVQLEFSETLTNQYKTLSVKMKNGARETVSITIPAGITNNTNIKYTGLGDNFFEGLPRGDLYVVVIINLPTNTQIRNDDVYQSIEVDVLDAIIGKELIVDTCFNESFSVIIPAGIQHGHKLRIKGKGLLVSGTRRHLYLEVKLIVPKNLSDDKLALIKQVQNGI
mgnify:CR=1 FL=1